MRRPPPTAPALGLPEAPDLSLPAGFWKQFMRHHWDRSPVRFERPFSANFPTRDEIYAALLEAGRQLRRGDFAPLRFFIEHESGGGRPLYSAVVFPYELVPTPSDGGLDAYLDRLQAALGGRRFGIVMDRCQTYDWRHWSQMKSFLAGFHQAAGVPLGASDSAVFIGNYRYTPFGIHKDDLQIFYFVVDGRKTMSFWPLETFADREEMPPGPDLAGRNATVVLRSAEEEREALALAHPLEAGPGDLLYWPASYWHRAEPSSGVSISVSLGVKFAPPLFGGGPPGPGDGPHRLRSGEMPTPGLWTLPEAVRASLAKREARAEVASARRAAVEEWVRFLTGGALEGAPPEVSGAPLQSRDLIYAPQGRRVVWVRQPGGHLIVSANARSEVLSASPGALRQVEWLLKALNGGGEHRVRELEQAFYARPSAHAFKPKALRALLNALLRWRAVERRPEP